MPVKLYRHPISGHSHRVQLALSLMGVPHELVHVDVLTGAHKRPDFLAMNPFGQVPVIDDDGVVLADSNAILVYLARRYDPEHRWLPTDPRAEAEVTRWFAVAAGPLAFGPALARVLVVLRKQAVPEEVITRSVALLGVMEAVLGQRPWLAGEAATLADLAMYTYTAHAPEGGIALDAYPNVRAWLARIEAMPGFVGMVRSA